MKNLGIALLLAAIATQAAQATDFDEYNSPRGVFVMTNDAEQNEVVAYDRRVLAVTQPAAAAVAAPSTRWDLKGR